MAEKNIFEAIIVGGSYAGLSAAMALGRSSRRTLIIDGGKPCNRQTPRSHNFITHDGNTPAHIASLAREQVLKYNDVSFVEGLVVGVDKKPSGFTIKTQSGQSYIAKKLILATGIKDELPPIPGFAECWGISVIHCPYCHGYEYRNKKTGIMSNGEVAMHFVPLVHNLTQELTLLTNGAADLSAEQKAQLEKNQISLIETEIASIEHQNGYLSQIILKSGGKLKLDALYAKIPFSQHNDLPVQLGLELTEQGLIKVDQMQKTNVDGVFACGDNSHGMRSVAQAVYSGNITGAVVNMELSREAF